MYRNETVMLLKINVFSTAQVLSVCLKHQALTVLEISDCSLAWQR